MTRNGGPGPTAEPFGDKYEFEPNSGCWLWARGISSRGYGTVCIRKKTVSAHRHSWSLAHGPIPAGLCVLHRCDTPPCVNPDHLFLGTRGDNNSDRSAKGRTFRGQGKWTAKFTVDQVREMRRLRASGLKLKEIGTIFETSFKTVHLIVSRKNWAWLQ